MNSSIRGQNKRLFFNYIAAREIQYRILNVRLWDFASEIEEWQNKQESAWRGWCQPTNVDS